MNRRERREAEVNAARLRKVLATDAGMVRFLDDLFGRGNHSYDPNEDVWVVKDKDHTGAGRAFLIVERGGNWFRSIIPDAVLS